MSGFKTKREKVRGRRQRVRAKIKANTKRFRLSLFRSNRHLWAQIIDDGHGNTLLAVSDLEVKAGWKASQKKVATPAFWAEEVGKLLAEKAQVKKISFRATVVIGNRNGKVGLGVGKGGDASVAIEKGVYQAKKNLVMVPLTAER